MPTVLLAGIPRAGGSFFCSLLNGLPGTVALDEPFALADVIGRRGTPTPDVAAERVGRLVHDARRTIALEHDLDREFLLVVKHNAAFAALLGPLAAAHRTFGVVRHPAAVLRSWERVAFPVHDGRSRWVEAFDAGLADALGRCEDRLTRQTVLLGWFYRRFDDSLPSDRVLHYEEVLASGGQALVPLAPAAAGLRRPTDTASTPMDARLADRLLVDEGSWWLFYDRASFEAALIADDADRNAEVTAASTA